MDPGLRRDPGRCRGRGFPYSAAVEGGHDLAGEPLQLLDEFGRRQAWWKACTTSSRIFSPFKVTIALSPFCAIRSIVRPLAIGMKISTGRCFGRGTIVISLRS